LHCDAAGKAASTRTTASILARAGQVLMLPAMIDDQLNAPVLSFRAFDFCTPSLRKLALKSSLSSLIA
jgi:hypothetical protein